MTIRKALLAFSAASIVFGGTAAVAAETLRQPATMSDSEELGGGGIGWIIALAVAAGVALVIIEDDDNEESESP